MCVFMCVFKFYEMTTLFASLSVWFDMNLRIVLTTEITPFEGSH